MRLKIWSAVVFLLISLPLAGSYLFNKTHVGWLIESVPDSIAYKDNWQTIINNLTEVEHPAVIHLLPENCLCRVLSAKHAGQITVQAQSAGFNVFQLNSGDSSLGQRVSAPDINTPFSPAIAITRDDGTLAYVGAYSDGIRCNTGTSMVDQFLESPASLPARTVVGLDVQTCRCLNSAGHL
ncbi:DUF6436 domain-containing protein [Reinekea marinisedimentorum]|uniref:DUF6436 domain-containing protein n=1 Tax=Reinekea marinisedimentorum TaxID=230495 RepID=A0A4R3I865_9GAMM|nr:DUF6436 domain-containing protein [Reinekea marinisedimentorum]TCS42442.1 hypothetical protein BCF53_103103 [Reinekea marinisedimentorum]